MKPLLKLALLTVLSLSSVSGLLRAGTFNFSYTTSPTDINAVPDTFSGTLTGTQVGDSLTGYITGVTVTSLFINSTQVNGTIFNSGWGPNPTSGYTGSGNAVVSFSRDQNNFIFVNSDYGNGNYSGNGAAYLFNASGLGYFVAAGINSISSPPIYFTDNGLGSWSLTNASSSVPDSGATLVLLGLTLGSLAAIRRKFGRN